VLHLSPAGNGETAKARGRSVIGVAFELGTELKQFVAAEICSRDFIQGMKYPKPHGDTAPESTTDWNIAPDVARKVEPLALSSGKKLSRCFPNHSIAVAGNT
jgi:hypothetical protein